MKKNFRFALVGAIALTGAVGISSCSSDKDVAEEVSPYYDSDKDEVVANFVFNVSNASRESTRQSSAATQATTSDQFRGIENAKLYCFVNGDANDGKHLAAAEAFDKKFDLAHVLSAGQVTATQSHRIIEIALPLKTNSLVFYGKAPGGTVSSPESAADYSANDVYGLIESKETNETATGLSDLCFTVATRLGSNSTKYHEVEKLLAAVLTCIMNTNLSQMAAVTATDRPTTDVTTTYGFDIDASTDVKAIKWEDYANSDKKSPANASHVLYPLEEKLADIYQQMTNIKTSDGELRAASGYAITSMVQDMWTVLNEVRWASPLSYEEAVAKLFAQKAFENVNDFFNYTSVGTSGGVVSGTSFESLTNLIDQVASNKFWPASAGTKPTASDFTNISASSNSAEKDMAKFPNSFRIPKGAAHVMFDTTKKSFAYPSSFNTSGMGTSGSFTPEDYFYCPEIMYYANSSIRTSATDHKNDYPDGVANWIDATKWTADWNGTHVTSATRSVAMKDNIHYGVSLLKTTVGLKGSTFYDNNHAIQKALNPSIGDNDEPDHVVTIGETTFTLTGVIVGGQSRNVGWNFVPRQVTVGESSGYQTGFTYDNAIPADAQPVPTASGNANYTMLFDNYDSSKGVDAQPEIAVALEFKNNGPAFYGNYNLIPKDGTFYLIGKLNPNKEGLAAITWPTDRVLPPYDESGNSIEAKRVFMQDYMTTANFVIGEKSLQAAYLTVPDLRATSLTLGLSVDIEWSTGLNFAEVELGK